MKYYGWYVSSSGCCGFAVEGFQEKKNRKKYVKEFKKKLAEIGLSNLASDAELYAAVFWELNQNGRSKDAKFILGGFYDTAKKSELLAFVQDFCERHS